MVISNFGFQSSRNVNKWENVEYYVHDGLPYLQNNLAEIKCKVIQKIVYESNTMFLAEVTDCRNNEDSIPLTYNDYRAYFKNDVLQALQQQKEKGDQMTEERKTMKAKNGSAPFAGMYMTETFRLKSFPTTGFAPCAALTKAFLNCSNQKPGTFPGFFVLLGFFPVSQPPGNHLQFSFHIIFNLLLNTVIKLKLF